MNILPLVRFFSGYVGFEGTGKFPERFLNLCARRGISVWDCRICDGKLCAKMAVRDYMRIRPVAYSTKMRLRVKRRRGFNFIVRRYRRRFGIPVGAAVYFGILWLLGSFIWNINIAGNVNLTASQLKNDLQQTGVYEGCFRRSIDTELCRQRLLINDHTVSWAALNIDGCILTLDVRETVDEQYSPTSGEPCNVVAKYDGRIISVKAYSGAVTVLTGEAVAKGDLLVSGVEDMKTGTTRFSHAYAEVTAECRHTESVYVPYKQIDTVTADVPLHRDVLHFFGINIPLFFGSAEENSVIRKQYIQPCIDKVRIPVGIIRGNVYTVTSRESVIGEDEARRLAGEQMKSLTDEKYGDTLQSVDSEKYEADSGGVRCTVTLTCIENIAVQEKITITP